MKISVNKFINAKIFLNYLTRMASYKHFYKSRKALAELDDNILKDIGITRAEANEEAAKPFWQCDKDSLISNRVKIKRTKRHNGFQKVRS